MYQTYDTSIGAIEALSSVLHFSPTEYDQKFNEDADTLVAGANEIIAKYQDPLRTADDRCWLDRLLTGLLAEAPTRGGQKHVATVLHLVERSDGQEGVIGVAKVWWERMICPILGDRNPTLPEDDGDEEYEEWDDTCYDSRQDPDYNFKMQVAEREEHCCAISKKFDATRLDELYDAGREAELPGRPEDLDRAILQAVHIIPFLPEDRPAQDGTRRKPPAHKIDPDHLPGSFSNSDRWDGGLLYETEDIVTTWNLLRAWATGIDIPYLAGDEIHSPSNGICMSAVMQAEFEEHLIYFDKDAYPESPNKYKVRCNLEGLPLANGALTADVEFPTAGTIAPPNPLYLKVHASMCKALRRHHRDIYKEHHMRSRY